jgi:predicted ATPase/signal transduction histidine kinase
MQISNYQAIEAVYTGSRTLVYRAIHIHNELPVVIKLLRNEYPSFSELVQFRNQYTIAKNLNSPLVIQTYSLESYRNSYALVMEDFQGISLQEWRSKNGRFLSLTDFLEIAITLCKALELLYQKRIIHKDIKPANILINPETKQVKLIDFSIASLLPRETQEIKNANALEGTLAYMSPEQTGRMNRGLDYRTDFYSLGITFYELLTGKLPFPVNDPHDPMELIHAHVAKIAPLVHEINPEIPLILSQIVQKLMAKNAEDRYQSALGLEFDLQKCLTQLQETREMPGFVIGERDKSDRFIIPNKLYGRQAEVEILLDAFERVSQGSKELMLVAGFSGIGKTAVVNEVHKPIVKQRGYFIKGKFDQFQRNIPFSAFVQAFRDLIGQLLSESDAQLEVWKTKILGALGDNAQVMIEVIPELVLILGSQPPAAELSGTAAQNRFNLLFQKFFRVFTTQDHPVVLFIDDLQWADSASLNLMQLLLGDGETRYLLFLGAYRDNEVSPVHPFMLTLRELQKSEVPINRISLMPLSRKSIGHLVADTLSCSLELAMPLTELVMSTAKGNPFFSTQLLKSLYEEGLIRFDRQERCWLWDRTAALTLTLPEDVVEFMALQLQKLPQATQEVLKLAACIGAEFDLATLAIVSQKTEVEVSVALWEALQEELILPMNQVYRFFQDSAEIPMMPQSIDVPYRFLHDRIQQAAYSLIPEDQKQQAHYQVGKLLLQQISPEAKEERIFELVNQLNYGASLISEQVERDELAKLNLIACRKARTTTAYQAAREYAAMGLALLGETAWQYHYAMTLDFHELAVEVAYICGDLSQMEDFIETVITKTHTLVEQTNVSCLKIQVYAVSKNSPIEAIKIALEFLKQLGVTFRETVTPQIIGQEINAINYLIGDREIKDLIDLPIMTDRKNLAIIQAITTLYPCLYITESPLFSLVSFFAIKLFIQYGNTSYSPTSYVVYALLFCRVLQDVNTAMEFGQLALAVNSKLADKTIKAEILSILGSFVLHRKLPLKDILPVLQESYLISLEIGNLFYVGYAANIFCLQSYFCGQSLGKLEEDIRAYSNQMLKLNQLVSGSYCRIYWQSTLNLLGLGEDPTILSGEAMQEDELLSLLLSNRNLGALFYLYLFKLSLSFLFGDIKLAKSLAIQGRKYLVASAGEVGEGVFYFYDSLIILASISSGFEETTTELLEQVTQNQNQLGQYWASFAPMNHQHKVDLVEAEKCRVLGNRAEAIDLYDKAIAGAKENEYIQEEALANELAAKFYLNWGKEKVAAGYMQEAYYCYARWGAKAKVHDLETRYPQLLQPILQPSQPSFSILETLTNYSVHSSALSSVPSTSSSISDALDFATILQAAQALSSTINLDQLLIQFTEIILQNSGADKCVLVLPQDETWLVRAISTTEGTTLWSEPLDGHPRLPVKLIQYIKRTQSMVMVDNLETDLPVIDDYLSQRRPKSLLGLPILNQRKLVGILYLRNRSTSGVFTRDRLTIINFLGTQAAISLENARLYQQAQNYAQQLEQSQLQIVQSEKMSALGNLVAGVAHEMNNPLGFISASLQQTKPTIEDILQHLKLYQEKLPNKSEEIIEHELEIDLEYNLTDLPKIINSMAMACDRLKNISTSLRTFSRADRDYKVPFYLYEGIDSTILILKHRLKTNNLRPAIEIITDYGSLPQIKCFPGQLNQVFMNILANAIDAIEEANQGRSFAEIEANPNKITITTTIVDRHAQISIMDNGKGMTEEIKAKIFDHLFTTKEVGKGTGLGLAIAKQIVEEKHNGTLSVISELGQGTEFIIALPLENT